MNRINPCSIEHIKEYGEICAKEVVLMGVEL